MDIGVCYYPEHWDECLWAEDAKRMVELGISHVRIGEFAWSRIERKEGEIQLDWLDRAIDILGKSGLKIILGTPTATPPIWVVNKHPDMLAVDENGNVRKFGSRRHYCFSYKGYQQECKKIVELLAKHYQDNPYIIAWQIDNEYDCHQTVLSYSKPAKFGFQEWLEEKYKSIDKLNQVWGNVFWSMEYNEFSEIDLPNSTVTTANPAHHFDFRHYSSDQLIKFNKVQVEVIRKYSKLPLIHNYMGKIINFDHFKVGNDLDIASFDSYPLGFLEDRVKADDEWKLRFMRQGEPDYQAFHHDLYRTVGKGRYWIMEQQPGPVNWAPFNPAPLKGMIKLWALEAYSHGAEVVSYFRWRQAPFAQEQMHSGILRPDNSEAMAYNEVKELKDDIKRLNNEGYSKKQLREVALIFDYHSAWGFDIEPQGKNFEYFELVFDYYKALRKLGFSIDILSPNQEDFSDYSMVVIPALMSWNDKINKAMNDFKGPLIMGPRAGVKEGVMSFPKNLAPNIPGFDCKLEYCESLRDDYKMPLKDGGNIVKWYEKISGIFEVVKETQNNDAAIISHSNLYYITGWLDQEAMMNFFSELCNKLAISYIDNIPVGLRISQTKSHKFYINYDKDDVNFDGLVIPSASVKIVLK